MLDSQTVNCPYCGEANEIDIDPSAGRVQSYVEDCQVCCRPWQVKVRISGATARVRLFTLDEEAFED